MSKRLEILEASLAKKNEIFNNKIDRHIADVKSANGQPLNDKRNGFKTIQRWDKQEESLRDYKKSIEKTERAIEWEKNKIRQVQKFNTPDFLKPYLENGTLTQWRKHPRFFFVKGVDKARIVLSPDGSIACRYVNKLSEDQYAIFKHVYDDIKSKQIDTD